MARLIPNGIGAIFITGHKHSGRSTMAQTLLEALCERRGGRIEAVDTGALVTTFGIGLRNGIGNSVQACLDSGAPIGDRLMNRIFDLWLRQECHRNHELKTIIVSGGPRTPGQTELLSLFSSYLLVNMESNRDEMLSIADELGWHDEFEHHWNNYSTVLLPAVQQLKSSRVLRVERGQPLKRRLDQVLSALSTDSRSPVPPEIVRAALKRVNDPRHQIHKHIATIDPPKATEFATVT
jgi:adenylate kinase family enzyme